jgi:hypothetical protein
MISFSNGTMLSSLQVENRTFSMLRRRSERGTGRAPIRWRVRPAPGSPLPELGEVLDVMRLIWALDHALQKASKRMNKGSDRPAALRDPDRLALSGHARGPDHRPRPGPGTRRVTARVADLRVAGDHLVRLPATTSGGPARPMT